MDAHSGPVAREQTGAATWGAFLRRYRNRHSRQERMKFGAQGHNPTVGLQKIVPRTGDQFEGQFRYARLPEKIR